MNIVRFEYDESALERENLMNSFFFQPSNTYRKSCENENGKIEFSIFLYDTVVDSICGVKLTIEWV